MNLNSNPIIIKLFISFKEKCVKSLEEDLHNRYSKDVNKLDSLVNYLDSSSIDIEDENIQIELNKFLEFLSLQNDKY